MREHTQDLPSPETPSPKLLLSRAVGRRTLFSSYSLGLCCWECAPHTRTIWSPERWLEMPASHCSPTESESAFYQNPRRFLGPAFLKLRQFFLPTSYPSSVIIRELFTEHPPHMCQALCRMLEINSEYDQSNSCLWS